MRDWCCTWGNNHASACNQLKRNEFRNCSSYFPPRHESCIEPNPPCWHTMYKAMSMANSLYSLPPHFATMWVTIEITYFWSAGINFKIYLTTIHFILWNHWSLDYYSCISNFLSASAIRIERISTCHCHNSYHHCDCHCLIVYCFIVLLFYCDDLHSTSLEYLYFHNTNSTCNTWCHTTWKHTK